MACSWCHCGKGSSETTLREQGTQPKTPSCPTRKYGSVGELWVFRVSGGIRVFIDQAAQDGFSPDLSYVDAGHGGAGALPSPSGTRRAMPLMRPDGVVMRLVSGQDRAQMPATEDQHPVQYLSAQGADEALAGRIHAQRLNSGTQNPGADGLEYGAGRGREVRSAVTDRRHQVRPVARTRSSGTASRVPAMRGPRGTAPGRASHGPRAPRN